MAEGDDKDKGKGKDPNDGTGKGVVETAKEKARTKAEKEVLAAFRKMQEEESGLDQPEAATTDIGSLGLSRLKELNKATRELVRSGRQFEKGGPVERSLQDSIAALDTFLGTARLARQAMTAMSGELEGLSQIAVLSRRAGTASQNLLGDLTKQAAVLKQLGLSYSDFNKNIEVGTNVLGLQANQIRALNDNIVSFADEVKMLPSTVSQNFRLVAQSMAYEGPKLVEQFKKMQQLSAQTGVSVGTLATGFGEGMDTISGAAGFAAKLNAILGYQAISPNELLMMDDADRAIHIRQLIRNHPIYNEIFQSQDSALSKFALQTISKSLGMSRADTRRFLRGAPPGQGGAENETDKKSLKSQIANEFGKSFSSATTNLLDGMNSFTSRFEVLADKVARQQLDPLALARLLERRGMIGTGDQPGGRLGPGTLAAMTVEMTKEFGDEFAKQLGLTGIARTRPGMTDDDVISQANLIFPNLLQLQRILQTFPTKSTARNSLKLKLRNLINRASQATTQRDVDALRRDIDKATQEASLVFKSASQRDTGFRQVSAFEMSGVNRVTKSLGARRRLLAVLRGFGQDEIGDELTDDQKKAIEEAAPEAGAKIIQDIDAELKKKNNQIKTGPRAGSKDAEDALDFINPKQASRTQGKVQRRPGDDLTDEVVTDQFAMRARAGKIPVAFRVDFTDGKFVETTAELIIGA